MAAQDGRGVLLYGLMNYICVLLKFLKLVFCYKLGMERILGSNPAVRVFASQDPTRKGRYQVLAILQDNID